MFKPSLLRISNGRILVKEKNWNSPKPVPPDKLKNIPTDVPEETVFTRKFSNEVGCCLVLVEVILSRTA